MTLTQPIEMDAKLQAELLEAYWDDPILAARQLFPHWFPRPMPWFHRGIIAVQLRRADFLLKFGEEQWPEATVRWTKKKLAKLVRCFTYPLDPSNPQSPQLPIFHIRYGEDGRTPIAVDMAIGQHTLIIIPRGFAKTTILNFCTCYRIAYRLTKFTVYISEAMTHAKDQLATIRRELAGNERLIAVFGRFKPDRTDDETWGAEAFETCTGVKLAAKGRGAQIRGMNKFGDRPDTINFDDVEDKESVATEVQREKTLSWHKSDVEQALKRGEFSTINGIGTILHSQALLPTLAKSKMYTTIRLGAIDPDGEPLWDDKAGMSMAAIEAKKNDFASVGKLYEFGLEFMSTVNESAKLKFRREYFRYEYHDPARCREDFVARAIHIDPAISAKADADYCVIAVVGLKETGHKHVCDVTVQRGMPMSAQIEEYFRLKLKWQCTHHSAESTAYQAALAQGIREHMFIKAKVHGPAAYFEIIDTWPSGRKIERVEGVLQPIMASGYLTFQQIWPELETMFQEWPNGKLDGPDCIAGAISTLEPFAPLSIENPSLLDKWGYEDHDHDAPCAAGRDEVP